MRSLTRVRPAILGFAALTASAFAQTPPMQSQFQVSQDTLSYQSTYGVAMDDAGRFVVTWLNYNGFDHTDDCTARLFDPSGAAEGNQFGISTSATDQFDGPVAKDASGRFMVVWFENETVMGRRFQPNGTPIGATFTITDSATNDVFVASDEAGNFVVTWSRFVSGPEFDVFARIYDSSGAPVGGEFPVNSYTTLQQQARGVARKAANGQFVITWVGFGAGGPGIWARTFDASGNPTTGELHVNQGAIPTVLPLSTVGINGAGEFVVAWEGVTAPPYQGIFARQFDSKGQPLGPQFTVSNGGTNDRRDPQIASDRSGNFLVTWTATNGDGDADAIGARAYDRFGTPTSSEFVVNEATTGSQYGARVAINDSSRFVVAWSTPDGSDYGVVARRSGVDASASIGVDSFASFDVPSAAGNGVLEPGETVDVATAWVNDTAGDLALSGAATDFSGPTGATYTLDDAVADYGTIAAGATGSCSTTTTTWIVNVGQDGTNFVDQVSGNSTSTIHVGDTVHWVWVEGGSHSSTSGPCPPCAGDEIWESPIQDNGTFDHTFNAAGNFPYFCIPHDVAMTGTVVVVPNTGNCYQVTVSAPATRPVPHWDAQLQEVLNVGVPKTWPLHIGESFPDVATDNIFYAFIETLFHNGITGGCAGGGYCPTNPVTRAQMAVFLLKAKFGAAHIPPPCTGTVFTDVPCTGGPFDPWIEELASLQITGGCGGGLYCPNNTVTRQQMAVFLLKALEGSTYVPPSCTGVFDDVACPSQFADWIEELADRQITGGCSVSPPLYCPTNPNNRGQMAVFLTKTFGLALYGP